MNMRRKGVGWVSVIFLLVAVGLLVAPVCFAYEGDDKEAERPERLIEMAAEYPGVEVPAEEDVTMDLIFHNKGRSDENVSVKVVSVPDGWEARVKTYRYTVTGIHVPGGDDKTSSSLAVSRTVRTASPC